jgi:hypothetical protein
MTVLSVATDITGLVAGYPLDESSGTNLNDFSANNLDATKGTAGTVGGAAVVPSAAFALTGDGGTTNAAATRAVAGGSPLQLTTFTYMIAVRVVALPASAQRGLFARNNNVQLRLSSAGLLSAYVWVNGAVVQRNFQTTLAAGGRYVPAVMYDGEYIELWLNGKIDGEKFEAPGTVTATTDQLEIMSYGTNVLSGQGNYLLIYNRRLEAGEYRRLYLEMDPTLERPEGLQFLDHQGDGNAAVAASASTRFCAVCGGRMRAIEPRRELAGKVRHRSCGAVMRRPRVPITAASTQAQFLAKAKDIAMSVLSSLPRRASAQGAIYHDGAIWRSPSMDNFATSYKEASGAGLMAAILARYDGADENSMLWRIAKHDMARLVYGIDARNYTLDQDFVLGNLGQFLVISRGRIDRALWVDTLERFRLACEFMHSGGTDATGTTRGSESTWYTNGNREVIETIARWCLKHLLALEGHPDAALWAARYEAQVTWMVGPTGSTSPRSGYIPVLNGGSVYGWKENVAPVDPNWADGRGWFREAGANGFFELNDAATFRDGLDCGYSALQLQFMLQLWLLSGEQRFLRYSNALFNEITGDSRINTSTWILDQTTGSRLNQTQSMTFAAHQALVWKGGRTGITDADRASQFANAMQGMTNNMKSPVSGGMRGYAYDLGSLFLAADDYGGH